MVTLIVIGSILGYSIIGGITYSVVYSTTSADEDGATVAALAWPLALPAILASVYADTRRIASKEKKQLAAAKVVKE
jgi:hypothetical protein